MTTNLPDVSNDGRRGGEDSINPAHSLSYPSLQDADAHLNKLRLYVRLVHQWEWLTAGQYEHVSKMVAEVGRLLGGWIKQTRGA